MSNGVRAYIGLLLCLLAVIVVTQFQLEDLSKDLLPWLALTALFFLSEYFDLYFHDVSARFGLSTSEAVLLPMVMGLSASQVLVGVSLAIAIERVLKRLGPTKVVFNVASYGIAAGACAATWRVLTDGRAAFSVQNAVAALLALLVFGILTHVFAAMVISLSQRRPVQELSRLLAPTTVTSTASSGVLGLLFAASYLEAQWTLILFPFALGGLYVANRSFIRQSRERERVQYIQAATRALAAGATLQEALRGFLDAVRDIASASEVILILRPATAGITIDSDWVQARLDATREPRLERVKPNDGAFKVIAAFDSEKNHLIANQDDERLAPLRAGLDVDSLIAARLIHEGHDHPIGYVIATGRIGAGDFTDDDGQLLLALGNELVLTLDSYRLFQQVVEERERFARIFAGSTEGICLIDSEGVVQAWNPALEMISGYSADEVMGRVWSEVVFLRDVDQQRVEATALVVIPPDEELELVTRSGPTRWVSVLSGPVQATDGGGWVALVRDVSAQHEVEQAKSDFLSTISHELRTPLTTIKGSLQVLERGPANLPGDLADQMIAVTTRGAERLERLVMNLLIVSQIESGTMPVFIDELVLQDIVHEKATSMLREHPRSSVDVPDERLVVRADRERVGQVVEHLIDNAIKFGGPNGHVDVSMTRVNGYVQISVRDEGPGIPSADRDRIFERFVRLGDVLTRETQGAGVGLFIAKLSVEAMQGEIWVESEPGQGSTFHVKLPMARPMAVDFASA